MKYLLVLAIVVVFVWHWRADRRADIAKKSGKVAATPKDLSSPEDMVQCDHCQVHLAQSDMVKGRKGQYCGVEHRALAET